MRAATNEHAPTVSELWAAAHQSSPESWLHKTKDERATNSRVRLKPDDQLTPELLAAKHAGQRVVDRLLTVADLEHLPDPEYLIDGFLVRNTLAVLYGKPGGGKSFVALDWALSVSSGSWWFRREVKQGPVLYVVTEGAQGFKLRVAAWRTGRNVTETGDVRFDPVTTNLLKTGEVDGLMVAAFMLQPSLMIIDTVSRSMPGGDENSPKDMSRLVESVDRIRGVCNACVLVVHHTTKAEGVLRGHSSLEGAADTVIECKGAEGRIRLTVEKQKDAPSGLQQHLYLTPVGDSCYLTDRPGPSHDFGLAGKRQDVLEALRKVDDGDGVTVTVWSDSAIGLSVSRSTFYECKKDLLVRGLVRKIGEGRGARFTVTPPTSGVDEPWQEF